MHRTPLLQLLETYRHTYPDEQAITDCFHQFVSDNVDCFERSLQVGHITGSAWVVNAEGTQVLLTHHRKLEKWLQLGGHADGDPDVLQVALREVKEESGLPEFQPVSPQIFDLDAHLIPARKNEPEHVHYDVRFAVQVTGSEQYQVSEESLDLAWVDIKKLHEYTQETCMLRMGRKWLTSQHDESGVPFPPGSRLH